MDQLFMYKSELINLAKTHRQKRFIQDAFPRWYMNCDKDDIWPLHDIVITRDLCYANVFKCTGFDIPVFVESANLLFERYIKNTEHAHVCVDHLQVNHTPSHKIITQTQFGRLRDIYNGNPNQFYQTIDRLMTLYELIGINNLHLSIPPIFNGIELFGSPLNTHNEYCSPFAIENRFGSLGSFWEYNFHKNGIYLCNPPFDDEIIERMADKLLADLSTTKHKVIVVVTIPVWDTTTQKKLGICDYGLDFKGITTLIKSQYMSEHALLDKNKFPYWNYYTEKLSYIGWTHLIVLTNLNGVFYKRNFSIDQIIHLWQQFKYEKSQ